MLGYCEPQGTAWELTLRPKAQMYEKLRLASLQKLFV